MAVLGLRAHQIRPCPKHSLRALILDAADYVGDL